MFDWGQGRATHTQAEQRGKELRIWSVQRVWNNYEITFCFADLKLCCSHSLSSFTGSTTTSSSILLTRWEEGTVMANPVSYALTYARQCANWKKKRFSLLDFSLYKEEPSIWSLLRFRESPCFWDTPFFCDNDDAYQLIRDYHDTARTINTAIKNAGWFNAFFFLSHHST